MVNPKNVTFPLTLEAFTALQEKKIGRKVFPAELEFFGEVVDMAIAAYRAGCVADAETVKALLDTVAAIDTGEPDTRHLCGLCRGWILEGARRGLELLASMEDDTPAAPFGLKS